MKRFVVAATLAATLATPVAAHAFCGFYVGGGGAALFNNATQVVLMRQGTRTVLSMQNNYQGPPSDFAMVVPVPVVLHEEDVKTLPMEVFAKVDQMGSPRLVEYWEQDPCAPDYGYDDMGPVRMMSGAAPDAEMAADGDLGVKIEAKFTVGEYNVLILSASDSSGLDTWLRQQKYNIPKGAEPLLRPYVEGGMKFFVAKVDPKKVKFVDGQAQLSPLRFHYDSDEFSLPIRLGLANSNGTQDLIVNILAPNQRYEVANYGNVTIPTNLDVKDETKTQFGAFYAALFDRTVEQNPGAVITEYAWDASTCDPCPAPQLDDGDFYTLGADVLGGDYWGLVLTRLHARYGKADMNDDLRFRAAKPIQGGRENWSAKGLEYGATPSSTNNFQGRYAIRHWWTGPIACKNPQRGVWGGPPDGGYRQPIAASKLAYAPRGKLALPTVIKRDLWEIGMKKSSSATPAPAPKPPGGGFSTPPGGKTMGFGFGGGILGGAALLGLLALVSRRKK